ncbi:MAG TPA: tape measure protein [Novosphingobium sp.]
MANEEERLVVALEARIRDFERNMQKAERAGTRSYQQLVAGSSRATRQMEQDMARATSRMNQALASSSLQVGVFSRAFGAIGAALSTREIIRYADAWTTAKNSLAVAGITGEEQVKVLNRLYAAAQANAAPISALADLFGKAAQASDNLGASQQDLLKFSAGVATSLRVAGTSATAASGALTQLGQLLGQARVQAEEFNSINEGARPILMAVAAGLDDAAGSVSRLKAMVNDGKVSGRQFFDAFLKGLPQIEAMAANATQTIDQGWTKVSNALTKYIGETDESLGASQRLVSGLNALADNFDETADLALKFAGILAGALVGRSILGMVSTLGAGTAALLSFAKALTAARSAGALTAAMGGLGAAAGPVGLVIGGTVVTALTFFSEASEEASAAAKTYAQTLDMVRAKAKEAGQEIEGAALAIDDKARNSIKGAIAEGAKDIEDTRDAVLGLFRDIIDNAPRRLVSEEQLTSLEELYSGLSKGEKTAADVDQALYALANSNPQFQKLADQLSPLLTRLAEAAAAVDILRGKLDPVSAGPSFRELENASMDAYRSMKTQADDFIREAARRAALTKDQLSLETEIGKVRTDALKEGVTLTERQIEAIAKANIEGDKARSLSGRRSSRGGVSEYEQLTRSIEQNIAAMKAEVAAANLTGSASSALRIEQDLLNGALQKGIKVTPQMADSFKNLAREAAVAEEALAAARLSQELLFERQQAGRSETEQRVYAELRAANIDVASVTGQRLADEVRITEEVLRQHDQWREMSDVIKDTLGDTLSEVFSGGIKSSDDFFDHLMKGFAGVGRGFARVDLLTILKNAGVAEGEQE